MFDAACLAPRHLHPALRTIATKGLLTLDYNDATSFTYAVSLSRVPADLPPDVAHRVRMVLNAVTVARSATDATSVLAVARALATPTGPVLLSPTPQQCAALAQVDLTLPAETYQQPFPILTVRIPDAYRNVLAAKFPLAVIPRVVVLCKEDATDAAPGILISVSLVSPLFSGQGDTRPTVTSCFTLSPGKTLDKMLTTTVNMDVDSPPYPDDDTDFMANAVCLRICLNLCLILANERKTRPHDPKATAKYQRWLRSENPETKADGESRLSAQFQELDLTGRVYFALATKPKMTPCHSPGDSDRSYRPHWRRGHWRTLDPEHNPKWKELKRTFIPAVLVNAHLDGDGRVVASVYQGRDEKSKI